jgi:hypothetical protein
MTKDKAQPAARFKLGFVTATVWKNGDFHSTVGHTKTATIGKRPNNLHMET